MSNYVGVDFEDPNNAWLGKFNSTNISSRILGILRGFK